ncbi:MAG TPA: sigma 54-interacting transcriptional regulator [Polyangiaceae bacterium]
MQLTADADPRDLSLGRDPACDVCIASKQVSRRHAVITQGTTGRGRITDLESSNGTRVNGRRVATAELQRGDVIRLGSWVGVVTESPSPFEELGPGLFGGATLQAVLAPLKQGAQSSMPVVIEGESGTGKQTVARSLHAWSGRKGGFAAFDCGATPTARVEVELFGQPTDGFHDASLGGLLSGTASGTLMLNQVSALSLGVQARLLDVMTRGGVHPIGAAAPSDARIVITTQESLASGVRDGRVHQELLAHVHIAGASVRLPPLRQRREDVAGIFLQLLRGLSERGRNLEISPDLIEKLCLHTWPFNVRELVGLTRRILTLHGDEPLLSEQHLPDRFTAVATDPFPSEERNKA